MTQGSALGERKGIETLPNPPAFPTLQPLTLPPYPRLRCTDFLLEPDSIAMSISKRTKPTTHNQEFKFCVLGHVSWNTDKDSILHS